MENTGNIQLDHFLSNYPDNATSWSQADDAIRDMNRTVRQFYNEMVLDLCEGDDGTVEALNFRAFKNPSEWNTNAKSQIIEVLNKMSEFQKMQCFSLIQVNFFL